ncbi:hypothetical protein Nans01_24370 [Nocardiopsis ansamitocini]|uniref:Transmembrane protein (PGPGW) n=2 Tax=Nocardiopsis ansamitocini TaxID=1670832 RepID=A0A9W6P6L0_9ACTN|nr:hypothetical protein Nans01_24370 [Nocardiopsis ansamitocini]
MHMRSHPALHLTWRVTIGVVGTLVVVAGLVMCVTPGPGIGGIILGLAILSTEFAWAHGLLRRAQRYAHMARVRAEVAIKTRRMRRRRS